MTEKYFDLITGKPLEPWAEQAINRNRSTVRAPSDPTPVMIAAGERAMVGMSNKHWGRAEKVYRAMLEAADDGERKDPSA